MNAQPDRPAPDGGRPPPAAVLETHCAVVFFVGDRAYKLKKPVDLGFLDFSTRERREAVCHREVELNRRLAPDVYLGVVDVVGPAGQVRDHLVEMRRMPDERRLRGLVERGVDVRGCLDAVARRLAALHASVGTCTDAPELAALATRDAVLANWQDNFDAIGRFVPTIVPEDDFARVRSLAQRYLAGREPLFTARIETGAVRDGHGDLLAEDIFCLDDGPRILDCLEFAERYRYGDVLLDAAFLAMDLERLGAPDLGRHFLRRYVDYAGEHHPDSLAHHYIAYRAHVRTKVACLRAEQGDPVAAEEARWLHHIALDHLRAGRVAVVLVGGLPGTGKSTVTSGLSDRLSWALLRTDEIRKDLAGVAHTTDARAAYGEGMYRPANVARAYEELLRRAQRLLERGESVILDASWVSATERRAAVQLAAACHADLVQLSCEAPLDVSRARMWGRDRAGTDASDATVEVLERMVHDADPWPDAVRVRTDAPIDTVLEQAYAAVLEQLTAAERHPTRV